MARLEISEVLPLNKEIVIKIVELNYGKHKNIIVVAKYEDIYFDFSVFWTNKFCSADNKFSFKIQNDYQILEAPKYNIIAEFDLTKNGYYKCLSARKE